MRRFVIPRLLIPFALLGTGACGAEAPEASSTRAPQAARTAAEETRSDRGDTWFSVSGDVTVNIDDATATLTRIRGRIPALTIVSSPASIRKHGSSYGTDLFFSDDFTPKPGTYPIEFSYRRQTNTLGGSFLHRADMFSHDTKGTAEFVEFGDRVKVRFRFQTFATSDGSADRRGVTVEGEAVCDCPLSDAFDNLTVTPTD
jgi:hypothetical protein